MDEIIKSIQVAMKWQLPKDVQPTIISSRLEERNYADDEYPSGYGYYNYLKAGETETEHLNNILNEIENKEYLLNMLNIISEFLNVPIEKTASYFTIIPSERASLIGHHWDFCSIFLDVFAKRYSELVSQNPPPQESISSVKKQIKYCKNPFEQKKLEQKLNKLYKERHKK
jgi:hypothetical protein